MINICLSLRLRIVCNPCQVPNKTSSSTENVHSACDVTSSGQDNIGLVVSLSTEHFKVLNFLNVRDKMLE